MIIRDHDPEKLDARARSAAAFAVPVDVEDKGTAFFTISVLPATVIVQGKPEHVVLYDPMKNGEGISLGLAIFSVHLGTSPLLV